MELEGTENTTAEEQLFFSYVLQDGEESSRALIILIWLLVEFVGAPLLLGALSYKVRGSLNYQTLIDKLFAYILSCCLLYALTTYNAFNLRFFLFFPRGVCVALTAHGAVTAFLVLLSLDEIMILRYLYTCVWKNVGALDDDFFGRLFLVANTVLGVVFAGLFVISKGYLNLTMAACEGVDPSLYSRQYVTPLHTPVPFLPAMNMLSCLLCSGSFLAIHLRARGSQIQDIPLHETMKAVFATTKWSTIVGFSLAIACTLPYIYAKSEIDSGRASELPKLLVTSALMLPLLPALLVLPGLLYLNDAGLRRHVWREVRDSAIGRTIQNLAHRIVVKMNSAAIHPF